ncbi:molybdate ABC transporter substrate-binding protein [Desulforhopalus sp. 52FAK]
MKRRSLILGLLLIFFGAQICAAETIYLSSAASMTDAMKEIISTFSAEHKDDKILPNFASSGSLAKQINQGAPAHLFISANPKWMKFLIDNKAIAPETNQVFAYNSLVFVGQNLEVTNLNEITKFSRIAIGSPGSVPAGQYAKQAMETAGMYSDLENKKILVMAKDVRQALLYADRGEVDGAFVYKTDALLAKNAAIAFTVPDDLYPRVKYPIALTPLGIKSALAKQLYDFMTSDKAQTILEKYGFKPAK